MHGLMSGGWKRGTVAGPQRLQLDAWTAPDLSATAPVLDSDHSRGAGCRRAEPRIEDNEQLAELGRLGARLVLQRAVEDEVARTARLGYLLCATAMAAF